MRTVPVRAAAALSVLLILSLIPVVSLAQEQSREKAKITVYSIEASNGQPAGIDPEIRGLVREIEGTLRYSSYHLVSKTPVRMGPDDREKIVLPGNHEMYMQMLGYEGSRIKMKVRLVEKQAKGKRDVLNTEFRLVEGGTMVIGGYEYHNGKMLIAISAK